MGANNEAIKEAIEASRHPLTKRRYHDHEEENSGKEEVDEDVDEEDRDEVIPWQPKMNENRGRHMMLFQNQ